MTSRQHHHSHKIDERKFVDKYLRRPIAAVEITLGRLFIYQFKMLLVRTLFITFIFTSILWLIQSLRFLEPVIGHGFSAWTFFKFIFLLMPFFLSTMLPVSFFIALVSTYQSFEKSNEFMMMRNSGLSPLRLAGPSLILSVLFTGLGYYLTLDLMPKSYAEFKVMERAIAKVDLTAFIESGKFEDVSKNVTLSVKDRSATNRLKGVFLSDHRDPQFLRTLTAESGKAISTKDGVVYLILESGVRQEQDLQSGATRSFTFDEYRLNLSLLLPPTLPPMPSLGERRLSELLNPTHFTSEKHKRELWSEGHHRLVSPLMFLTFATLVSLFFFTLRPLSSALRLSAVMGSMITVYVLVLVFKYWAPQFPAALYGMYVTTILPIIVGFFILRQRS